MHTHGEREQERHRDGAWYRGHGLRRPGAWGAPYFNVQGYSPIGDSYVATPMHAWDTVVEGRDTLNWQIGRHSVKFGGAYQKFIWPMWGFFQNRGYYQFTNGFTTEYAVNDGTRVGAGELSNWGSRQRGRGRRAFRRWICASGMRTDTRRTRGG